MFRKIKASNMFSIIYTHGLLWGCLWSPPPGPPSPRQQKLHIAQQSLHWCKSAVILAIWWYWEPLQARTAFEGGKSRRYYLPILLTTHWLTAKAHGTSASAYPLNPSVTISMLEIKGNQVLQPPACRVVKGPRIMHEYTLFKNGGFCF